MFVKRTYLLGVSPLPGIYLQDKARRKVRGHAGSRDLALTLPWKLSSLI